MLSKTEEDAQAFLMNNFKKYRLLFLENKISKVEFIDFMYNIHQTLFEYSDEIKNKSYLLAFIEKYKDNYGSDAFGRNSDIPK